MLCTVDIKTNRYYVVGNHNAILSILKAYGIKYESVKECFLAKGTYPVLWDIGRLINNLNENPYYGEPDSKEDIRSLHKDYIKQNPV